jgi:predicted DNA-binding transcriptional regulator YafY
MRGSSTLPGLGRVYQETRRISRILELIQIINAGPGRYRRRDLAARFEISERMVQKDLDVIRNGLKLALSRSSEGYRFEDLPRLPAVGFSFAEAVSLLLAVEASRNNTGISTEELESALTRLRGLFPPEFARCVRGLSKPAKMVRSVLGEHRRQILELLQRAVLEGRKVRMIYSTSSRGGEESLRVVRPYHILSYIKSWHLVAHCEMRNTVLTFKIDRIRKAQLLSERFTAPFDFSLEEHLGDGWGIMSGQEGDAMDVELLFEPEAGRWVREEHWHKSQRVEVLATGFVRFRLHLPATPDFVSWILYYGSRVEVLSPDELRDRVAKEHQRAVERYRPGGRKRKKGGSSK